MKIYQIIFLSSLLICNIDVMASDSTTSNMITVGACAAFSGLTHASLKPNATVGDIVTSTSCVATTAYGLQQNNPYIISAGLLGFWVYTKLMR